MPKASEEEVGDQGEERARRVLLGVPGFDDVFPNGLRPGSLILIAGPPGSGKTLLAMQLLMEMRLSGGQSARADAFLCSLDEDVNILKKQIRAVFDKNPKALNIQRVPSQLTQAEGRIAEQQRQAPVVNLLRSAEHVDKSIRREAVAMFLEALSRRFLGAALYERYFAVAAPADDEQGPAPPKTPLKGAQHRAIGIDGLLNIPELRGADLDERRDALRATAVRLRMIMDAVESSGTTPLAAIMTAELPTPESGGEFRQIEEYLADVVIHVRVDVPFPQKRRRLLEVRKARYAESILGDHSFWIMSPKEVKERHALAATVGWSRQALKASIRPGVVVFPRMRWRPRRHESLESALVEVRRQLSSNRHYEDILRKCDVQGVLARDLSGAPLTVNDLTHALRATDLLLSLAIDPPADETLKSDPPWSGPELGAERESGELIGLFEQIRWDLVEASLAQLVETYAGLADGGQDLMNQNVESKQVGVFERCVRDGREEARLIGAQPGPNPILKRLQQARECRTGEECSKWVDDLAADIQRNESLTDLNWEVPACRTFLLHALSVLAHVCVRSDAEQRSSDFASFGIDGLDQMFDVRPGSDVRGTKRGSSTLIIGGPGTGKSMLAYSFLLRGLNDGDDVIFLSFDERNRHILRQAGNLTVQAADGKLDPRSLSSMTARQILLADVRERSPDETDAPATHEPRFQFVYENPVSADLDQLIHLLSREMEDPRERSSRPHMQRRCRLIIDSLSDLERNIRDPLVFNDFVITLLNKAADWNVTSVLTYEAAPVGGQTVPTSSSLSFLADSVIVLRHVEVNNATRKCVTIQKARGRKNDTSTQELVFQRGTGDSFYVRVRKGFEGMAKVLSGRPEPATVELHLFHENDPEQNCNERFVDEMKQRLGDRVRYVPFVASELRRAFWERESGVDVRPDADVTIVALDQPWVKLFASLSSDEPSPLAHWEPGNADVSERLLVSQLDRHVLSRAEVLDHPSPGSDRLAGLDRPLVALPHYYDQGFLLERTDLVTATDLRPTHWEDVPGARENPLNHSSFETVVADLSRRLSVPGFAFNMGNIETVACVFIEMCWNFFCDRDFLTSRPRDPKKTNGNPQYDWNLDRATDAMLFLWRLRWRGVLPFPCSFEDCSRAIYVRAWYANLPNIHKYAAGSPEIPLKPVPFLASVRQFDDSFENVLSELRTQTEKRITKLKRALENTTESPRGHSEDRSYIDWVLRQNHDLQLQEDLERIERRRAELDGFRKNPSTRLTGWACSGAWYLGVLSGGANAKLGWSLVREALDPERVKRRALEGAGLPAFRNFYREYGHHPVPYLTNTTFGILLDELFGRTRSRETAMGIPSGDASDRPADWPAVTREKEIPEVLHGMVMMILSDEKHRLNEKYAPEFNYTRGWIREQIERVLAHTSGSGIIAAKQKTMGFVRSIPQPPGKKPAAISKKSPSQQN